MSSSSPADSRKKAFRKLLCDLSEHLHDADVKQIQYIEALPSCENSLDLLIELEKRGKFSPTTSGRLAEVLRGINRHDLADKVKDDYQTTYPDVVHRRITRGGSKSLPPSQSPHFPRVTRAQTLSNTIPEIKVTFHESESQPELGSLHRDREKAMTSCSLLSPPQSFADAAPDSPVHLSENVPPQPPPSSIGVQLDQLLQASSSSDMLEQFQSINSGSSVSMSDSLVSENENVPSISQRRWSEGGKIIIHNITVNNLPSPPTSYPGSCERLPSPHQDVRSMKQQRQGHRPLNAAHSAPSTVYQQEYNRSQCANEQLLSHSDDDCGALSMHAPTEECETWDKEVDRGLRPRSKVVSRKLDVDACEKIDDSVRHQSFTERHTEGFPSKKKKWRSISLPSTKSLKIEERTKCTRIVKRKSLVDIIWDHKLMNHFKFSEKLPIDIKCGKLNPCISLRLYPYGLFNDENKSMTLLLKVVIPDDCPPIPLSAKFSLAWRIGAVKPKTEELRRSKKAIKVGFDMGVVYVHGFLSHTTLQKHCCEDLEIQMFVSTSYSTRSSHESDMHSNLSNNTTDAAAGKDYTYKAGSNDIEQRPTLPQLNNFQTSSGSRNIAQEIGTDFDQFGCLLLDDTTGAVTTGIAHGNSDPASINREILQHWVQGKGRLPVQWSTLVNVLKDVKQITLATDIEENLKLNLSSSS